VNVPVNRLPEVQVHTLSHSNDFPHFDCAGFPICQALRLKLPILAEEQRASRHGKHQ
jgi:hypothetical protein